MRIRANRHMGRRIRGKSDIPSSVGNRREGAGLSDSTGGDLPPAPNQTPNLSLTIPIPPSHDPTGAIRGQKGPGSRSRPLCGWRSPFPSFGPFLIDTCFVKHYSEQKFKRAGRFPRARTKNDRPSENEAMEEFYGVFNENPLELSANFTHVCAAGNGLGGGHSRCRGYGLDPDEQGVGWIHH